MKRLFVLAAAALSLTLFSFVAPENGGNKYGQGTNGVTRVGAHDFIQDGTSRFTADEKAVFDKMMQEQYHITSARLGAGSTVVLESAQRGFWLSRNEIWTQDEFQRKSFIGTNAVSTPVLQQAEAILAKYADAK